MSIPVLAAILGVIGGLASGALSAWVALRGKRLDHEVERTKLWVAAYETTLFDQRLKEYRVLWRLTERTSQRHIAQLSAAKAADLEEKLTRWYYREGGILLSAESRNAFFRARRSLVGFDSKHARPVTGVFSSLRTALCDDLNSRKGPMLIADDESSACDDDIPETVSSAKKS